MYTCEGGHNLQSYSNSQTGSAWRGGLLGDATSETGPLLGPPDPGRGTSVNETGVEVVVSRSFLGVVDLFLSIRGIRICSVVDWGMPEGVEVGMGEAGS